MIIYFYEFTYKNKPVNKNSRPLWVQHWTRNRKKFVKRIESNAKHEMVTQPKSFPLILVYLF
ncbi:hypothetical protein AHAS_Ahas06G0145400 [Arachis hypogaea]